MKERSETRRPDTEDERTTTTRARFEALSSPAQARAQRGYERLAGDEGLTGALTDAAARDLLDRAQQEVIRLAAAAETMPDSEEAETWFAGRLAELRTQLRRQARSTASAATSREADDDTTTHARGSDL